MSGDAQQQLQKAIYDTLTAALAAAGPGGAAVPVLDDVPQNQPYPYVAFGDGNQGPFETDTETGQEHMVELHVYMRNDLAGKKSTQELLKKIRDALDNQNLVLAAGASLLYLYYDFSTTYPDPDNKTYHGVTRFKGVTLEAA